MSGFTVSALLILAVGLYYNYQQDQGQHQKAKVWQAICLGLLVQAYASTLRQAIWLMGNWETAHQKFSQVVGYVSGGVHWLLYLLHIGLALLTLATVLGMISRSNVARHRLFWLLPLLVVVETFSFYRGWLTSGPEEPAMHGFILLLGLVFNGAVALGMTLVYRSRFMKAFYQVDPITVETVAVAE